MGPCRRPRTDHRPHLNETNARHSPVPAPLLNRSLIASGKLGTPIQATYDVAQVKEAVAAAAAGERQGEILITPKH